ncbi:multidrug oligosaccharidyl-lipid polysaccharide flippase [Moniliophthora roreri MCA 2997]|uniref:Multidrug oligosaccharidyl-lipid polysaccharide flippase n=1 Tax=Moniliophthora roreri (strain MCA 2997) TaxID=1381753 RepID=V2WVD5_MONRO|nr:multidrug oligosaccharidyl-lipid polysaccharide flippase [Moniliophthora roreri MCA 2997]
MVRRLSISGQKVPVDDVSSGPSASRKNIGWTQDPAGEGDVSPSGDSEHPTNENTPLLDHQLRRNNSTRSLNSAKDVKGENVSPSSMLWSEAVMVMKYALPVFGLNVMEYSLVVVSVLSIGHLSTAALAAITLGEMTVNVTGLSIILGFASALDTLLPSAWTSDQPQLVGLWSQRMMVVIAVALVPILALWLNSESVLLLLRQEREVARLASIYIRWMCLGLPAFTFNSVARRYFMCQGLFTVPGYIIVAVAPINALVNYLLVWGPEVMRLGFIGAPIATSMSYYIISVSYIIYGTYYAPRKAWHPITMGMFSNLWLIVKLGLAGVGQTASEWWAWDVLALIASQLGSDVVLAAQSVLVVTSSSTWQAPFAISIAASIRIGNLLGERKATRAGVAAKASILLGLVVAGVFCVLLLIFRERWSYLFNENPKVATLVSTVLPLMALFQVFDATAAVTSGILRARGKQITGALLNISAYYIFGIPLGAWLAFKWNLGLQGLWIGITSALIWCGAVGVILSVWTPDWHEEVRKVLARLEEGKLSEQASECDPEEGSQSRND